MSIRHILLGSAAAALIAAIAPAAAAHTATASLSAPSVEGMQLALMRHGGDDPAGHDANDDHGGRGREPGDDRHGRGNDDPPGHDADDDHGGRGHEPGDDHGHHGRGHDDPPGHT